MAKKAKPKERTCVWCGCTDSHACPGGCHWMIIHPATPTGVCSNCIEREINRVNHPGGENG